MKLTQKELMGRLKYNPLTGIFINKKSGARAGGVEKDGYRKIKVLGKNYREHRLAFLYMTGSFPVNQCDHINHKRDDNRWSNLRDVLNSENHKNRSKHRVSKSGHAGVYWHARDKRWVARIMSNYKLIHLGNYINIKDAVKARSKAEVEYGFHKNHGK